MNSSPDPRQPPRRSIPRSAMQIEERLAATAGVERRRGDELALTTDGISACFPTLSLGARKRLLTELNLPPIQVTKVDRAQVKVGHCELSCRLRRERGRLVWTLPKSELQELAKLVVPRGRVSAVPAVKIVPFDRSGTVTTAPTNENSEVEGAESGESISITPEMFIGNEVDIKQAIGARLPDSPKNYLIIEHAGVEVELRRDGATENGVWRCRENDVGWVAAFLGFPLKGALLRAPAGWIPLTAKSLGQQFAGDGRVMYSQLCSRVSTPERSSPPEKVVVTKEHNITCRLARVGNQIAWAVSENELEVLGRDFGWEQRLDISKMLDSPELTSAVALLHEDPLLLLHYIQLHHPELNSDQVTEVSLQALRGFAGERQEEIDPLEHYSVGLVINSLSVGDKIVHFADGIIENGLETAEPAIQITGRADPRAEAIQITGAYNRRIRVTADGKFEGRLPLPKIGAENHFLLYAVSDGRKEMSDVVAFSVRQIGTKTDTNEVFLNLVTLKDSARTALLNSAERQDTLRRAIEVSCLKWFTENEVVGFRELDQRIATAEPERKKMLDNVRHKFQAVAALDCGLRPGEELLFFQKYTVFEIKRLFSEGRPGVILASEQGTGKTLIAQCLFDPKRTTVIAPNAVVSTWLSEERRFFPEPVLVSIEGKYRERDDLLRDGQPPFLVTNIEFLRNSTETRIAGLSAPEGVLILDEADFIGQRSLQAEGAHRLAAKRKLLMSATPFRRPAQVARMLHFLEPSDTRFSSGRSLARAFPENSSDSLRLLHSLVRAHSIRIRKRDVFRTFDRRLPLSAQARRLPEKIAMDSALGQFELRPEQCQSIRELFEDYAGWCGRHRGRETTEDRSFYRFSEGFFSRRESLRQLMNDPRYIGHDLESPKHQAMARIVRPELKANPVAKVLIFCRYRAQIEAYSRMFADLGVCRYFGGLPSSHDGYRLDMSGNLIEYVRNDRGEHILDEQGIPVVAVSGARAPMKALDYERMVFQNSPQFRVMVATYDSGKVGVTLTAASTVIFDDLASSYPDEYQAGDRAHRIDERHKKYEVRYFWLTARYPQSFLRTLPDELFERFFSQGSYDQVAFAALRAQERVFHRIMDGVGSESELTAIQDRLKLYLAD